MTNGLNEAGYAGVLVITILVANVVRRDGVGLRIVGVTITYGGAAMLTAELANLLPAGMTIGECKVDGVSR